jgi:hypothetical protein
MSYLQWELTDSQVYRGGKTSNDRTAETRNMSLVASQSSTMPSFTLVFDLASKGGGTTVVSTRIGLGDFATILSAISFAHRDVSIRLMAAELNRLLNTEEVS